MPITRDRHKTKLAEKIQYYKRKLSILEQEDIEKSSKEMMAILSHTHAIDDKYNCRSVKFMFRVADFVEKYISVVLGKLIAKYTVEKIHAPICSIVAGSKPELPPMPVHSDNKARDNEMEKFLNISVNLLEKPLTFRERAYINYNRYVRKLLKIQ
jgi:hypothetical protein